MKYNLSLKRRVSPNQMLRDGPESTLSRALFRKQRQSSNKTYQKWYLSRKKVTF